MKNTNNWKCPSCGWVGTKNQMDADALWSGAEEAWSNCICPQCKSWNDTEEDSPEDSDWIKVFIAHKQHPFRIVEIEVSVYYRGIVLAFSNGILIDLDFDHISGLEKIPKTDLENFEIDLEDEGGRITWNPDKTPSVDFYPLHFLSNLFGDDK